MGCYAEHVMVCSMCLVSAELHSCWDSACGVMSDVGWLPQISRQSLASKQQLTDAAVTSLAHQSIQQQQMQQSLQQHLREQQLLQQNQQASPPAQGKQQQEQTRDDKAKPPWYKRQKSFVAVVWGAASLLQHNNMILRSLKVASLLYIVQNHDR